MPAAGPHTFTGGSRAVASLITVIDQSSALASTAPRTFSSNSPITQIGPFGTLSPTHSATPTAARTAAVRAFSSNFSIAKCDAVYGRSLIVAHRFEAVRPALACGLAVRQA
jgi:hypothetical protein